MRVNWKGGVLFIFMVSLCLALWAGERNPQEKSAVKEEKKSLIKKELLVRTKQKLSPPRRNIFSLLRIESRDTRVLPENPQPIQKKTAGIIKDEPSGPPQMHIRYIGHIRSGKKIVALIILEDSAFAVEKGEMISEGVQIGEITPEYIEIIGPDSVRKKYTLEGEKE